MPGGPPREGQPSQALKGERVLCRGAGWAQASASPPCHGFSRIPRALAHLPGSQHFFHSQQRQEMGRVRLASGKAVERFKKIVLPKEETVSEP